VVLRVRSGGDESSLVAGVLALKNANFIRQNGSTSRTFSGLCSFAFGINVTDERRRRRVGAMRRTI
jgi:hypothetical protein